MRRRTAAYQIAAAREGAWSHLPGKNAIFSLVVQLQSELDLPRIVWRIARRTNFAEIRVVEVPGIRNCHHSVSAESRSVEVRMIEDVEELRPELQREALSQPEVLERGEVKAMEAWPSGLGRTATGCRNTGERNASRWAIWCRNRRGDRTAQYAGLCKSSGVPEPTQLSVAVGVQS